MKNLILLAFLFTTISANAQLSHKSEWVRSNRQGIYLEIFSEAAKQWDGDERMIVHFIDTQCEAFCKLFNEPYKSYALSKEGTEEYDVIMDLISKWSEARGEINYVNYSMIIYGIDKHIINSVYN